jgi:DNA modification methylase
MGRCIVASHRLPTGVFRSYGTQPQIWPDTWRGELGLEPTPELYVAHIVEVFREVRRVLRPDGTLFLNLGDSFWGPQGRGDGKGNEHGQKIKQGASRECLALKPKDLCMIPARVALALQADGWWLRSDIIWSKPNPMPESVNGWRWEQHRTLQWPDGSRYKKVKGQERPKEVEWRDCPGCDVCLPNDGLVLLKGAWRPTRSHEYIFLLTKSEEYFGDAEAVREPMSTPPEAIIARVNAAKKARIDKICPNDVAKIDRFAATTEAYAPSGRNLRSVWSFATQNFREAHFATFPEELVKRCILAGTSHKACEICGAAWMRVVEKHFIQEKSERNRGRDKGKDTESKAMTLGCGGKIGHNENNTLGFRPSCKCQQTGVGKCLVLDPFLGSGTVGQVAEELGREWVGIELKPEYVKMAHKRTSTTQGMAI